MKFYQISIGYFVAVLLSQGLTPSGREFVILCGTWAGAAGLRAASILYGDWVLSRERRAHRAALDRRVDVALAESGLYIPHANEDLGYRYHMTATGNIYECGPFMRTRKVGGETGGQVEGQK